MYEYKCICRTNKSAKSKSRLVKFEDLHTRPKYSSFIKTKIQLLLSVGIYYSGTICTNQGFSVRPSSLNRLGNVPALIDPFL